MAATVLEMTEYMHWGFSYVYNKNEKEGEQLLRIDSRQLFSEENFPRIITKVSVQKCSSSNPFGIWEKLQSNMNAKWFYSSKKRVGTW